MRYGVKTARYPIRVKKVHVKSHALNSLIEIKFPFDLLGLMSPSTNLESKLLYFACDVGFTADACCGAPLDLTSAIGSMFRGRFDSLTPQITSAYSRIVRSVENFAIDVAASMLNLHHFCLSA